MKKIIRVAMTAFLALGLTGCGSLLGTSGGTDLDRTLGFSNGLTFNVSSSWGQGTIEDMSGESYVFTTRAGDIRAYSLDFPVDPLEQEDTLLKAMEDSNSYTNIKVFPRMVSEVNGAELTVFEYSFTNIDAGDTSMKNAYVVSGDATVKFFYYASTKDYNPEYFDAVIESIRWENAAPQSTATTNTNTNTSTNTNTGTSASTGQSGGTAGASDKDVALLTSGVWRTELTPGGYAAAIDGYLYIRADGSLSWDFGTGYSPAGMGMVTHNGTWSVTASELSSFSGNTIKFFLTIDDVSWVDHVYYFSMLEGIYQYDVTANTLTLKLLSGDALYHDSIGGSVVPIDTYVFRLEWLY